MKKFSESEKVKLLNWPYLTMLVLITLDQFMGLAKKMLRS